MKHTGLQVNRLVTLLLCVGFAATSVLPCFAEGIATAETASMLTEELADEAASAANPEQQAILDEAMLLTAGTDYLENYVLLHSVSEAEAKEAAAKLDAEVAYYASGSATLACNNSVVTTMTNALTISDLPLLYLNHIYHIESVEPDIAETTVNSDSAYGAYLYNDPNLGQQWYHGFVGSSTAWEYGITGVGVTVAVLDSGVVAGHPDLSVDNYIDSLRIYSAENGGTPYDSCGHGTSVAGVIAATANNGIGGCGIAPGVTLISCKAADNSDNFYDDTLNWGIHDAVDAGANVINISCDFPSDNNGYLSEAIAYAKSHGCIIVAAAGNDATNAVRYLPANNDVIGVGALLQDGSGASYSNFGANVNIMAPGTSLYTPGLDGSFNPEFGATSGAAAVVSGAVALAIAADPDLLTIASNHTGSGAFVDTVLRRIYGAATPMGDAAYYGYGALNLLSLLKGTAAGSSVSDFVTRLYSTCLERSPDANGANYWIEALSSHKVTGAQAAYGFIFSDEFKAKNYCNKDYSSTLYHALMGREPDDAGLDYWIGLLQSGTTREGVFNGFIQSNEFRKLCTKYNIIVGDSVAIPTYGTVPTGNCAACGELDGVTAFVTRLYRVCLDREPESGGLAYWRSRLYTHSDTGRNAANGFIFSNEFQRKNLSNEKYIEYMYHAFLGRNADAQGKAYWMNLMENGATRVDIFNGFADSREFKTICLQYGIAI